MPLVTYLKPETAMLLRSSTRETVLTEMVQKVCQSWPGLDADTVRLEVARREDELNTCVAPGIALPHARISGMDSFAVAVGLSKPGVPWGPETNDAPVHVVAMVLGDENRADEHIRILGQIASVFSKPDMLERLQRCEDAGSLYQQLIEDESPLPSPDDIRAAKQNRALVEQASQLSESLSASAVIILGPHHMGRYLGNVTRSQHRAWLLAAPATPRERVAEDGVFDAMISIPSRGLSGRQRVNVVVLIGLLNGLIQGEDVAICVYGREESHILDTIHVVDLRHQFKELLMLSHEIRDSDIEPEVLYRVLQLANDLAIEGREGHPVGTLFTLGDYDHVAGHTHQIVINPFRGYPSDEKNILDPSLAETLKEFALLDGAFVIRGNGEVMSAGACVQIQAPADELVSGLGTRHAAGMAISAATRTLAIVLSQSTGAVSVYKSGRRILTLTRSRE